MSGVKKALQKNDVRGGGSWLRPENAGTKEKLLQLCKSLVLAAEIAFDALTVSVVVNSNYINLV